MSIPSFLPRFRWQLGRGTPVEDGVDGSKDCNVRVFQHQVGFLTKDVAVPWVGLIREWMGRAGGTGTNLWNSQAAMRRMDSWLGRLGRKPIRGYLKFHKRAVRDAIRNGRGVGIAVDYGKWNELMGSSGDPNYRGGHGIWAVGEKRWKDGTIVWLIYDSLEDNRRNTIPQGPKWRPRWKVLKAAEVWARRTNGTEVVALVARGGGKA